MIDIDFGPLGGGVRKFRDLVQVREHAQNEQRAWEDVAYAPQIQQVRNDSEQSVRSLSERWQAVQNHISNLGATPNMETAPHELSNLFKNTRLVSVNSFEGATIASIGADHGRDAAAGAIYAALAVDSDQTFAQLVVRQLEGALRFLAITSGLTKETSSTARASIRKTIEHLTAAASIYEGVLEQKLAGHEGDFNEFRNAIETDRAAFSTYRASEASAGEEERTLRAAEWADLKNLYENQLTIQGPVRLWKGRSRAHGTAAKAYRTWACCLGIGGLVLGAVLMRFAFIPGVNWLFSKGLGLPAGAGQAASQEVSWKYEFGLLAAATLIFLTLYLWVMRVVMRMYLTEHHLAIDASSRSAMAYTYLALTKTGAADTTDRAIVLASLFRPLTDGIVKDDSSPVLSPAGILAAQLAKH